MVERSRLAIRTLLARGLVLESPVWSWVMVIGALLRASSYWLRPPDNSPTTVRIEEVLSYQMWTVGLLLYAVLISVGVYLCRNIVAWLGHLLGMGANVTLALSVFAAAAFDGEPWAAFWPLVVSALIHWGRLNALGPGVAEKVKRGRRVA